MEDEERILRIERALEEFQQRRLRGECPSPGEYAATLGDAYREFLSGLDEASRLLGIGAESREAGAGTRVGDYLLRGILGSGASGVVHRAEHSKTGASVALKILSASLEMDARAAERFRREVAVAQSVRHPHLVALLDCGEWRGLPYFVMEYLPGRSLADLMRTGDLPPQERLLAGLADVAEALHFLHCQTPPILHRDVKPSNILYGADRGMVLSDLGIARLSGVSRLSRTGEILGTVGYMAPEQASGSGTDVDARGDVYSLGATLCDLLGGHARFPGLGRTTLLASLCGRPRRTPPPPGVSASSDLARIVLACLAERREERPATAALVAMALRRA